MKILVVSFDKSLVKGIKEALREYEVIDVKNGEEAVNTVSGYVDAVVYDAISGSISEEDINNMYQKKFKEAKYVVLVDELFPVDMNNILVKKKVKLPREEATSRIKEAILEEPQEIPETPQVEELMELPQIESFTEIPKTEEPIVEFTQIETPSFSSPQTKASESGKKVLIVSFDSALTDTIKATLGTDYEIVNVKNVKEAMDKAKEADLIIFDTISGMIAQKALIDMSQKEEISQKPYILLIDDLFTIDVDKIPLPNKYSFSREAQLGRALEKVRELLTVPSHEEISQLPAETSPAPEEEVSKEVLGLLDELFKEQKTEELPVQETEPAKEPISIVGHDLEQALKEHIKDILSQKLIEDALKGVMQGFPITSIIEKVIKEEVNRQISLIDIASIVREEASKALRERLKELIT